MSAANTFPPPRAPCRGQQRTLKAPGSNLMLKQQRLPLNNISLKDNLSHVKDLILLGPFFLLFSKLQKQEFLLQVQYCNTLHAWLMRNGSFQLQERCERVAMSFYQPAKSIQPENSPSTFNQPLWSIF